MPSQTTNPQLRASDLLLQGQIVEASTCLSDAIRQGESADLWNDWAVVQFSLAEQAFRHALELAPAHPDAPSNLGSLLFTLGKREEAAALLAQSLPFAAGPALAQIKTLLRFCSDSGNQPQSAAPLEPSPKSASAPNRLQCSCGHSPLIQRGKKIGRPRSSEFHQATRCNSCGFMSFDAPPLDFLAEYYKGEYTRNAASWYNAANDYDPIRTASRADDVLRYLKKYIDCPQPLLHECGCSFGGTVAKLRDLGFQATGTDLNSTAIAEGSRKNPWIFAESERDFFHRHSGQDFHAIYLYHVLEHMPSPLDFLQDIRPAIEKSGIVFIAIPNSVNYFSLSKSFEENSWFAYPDHLNYFSPGSLPCLARASGYALLELETRMLAASEADAQSLFSCKPDSQQWQLTEHLIQQSLLGHELRFVLTPLSSSVATRFTPQIRATQALCESAKQNELRLLDLAAAQ
jgi:SAM-dependent methyltransferase